MRNTTILRRGIAAIAALALAGSLAACAQSQRETGSTTEEGSGGGDFVFAASSDPVMLDPAMASDGETFRVARQQFEGLVGAKPGTTELEPLLATEWKASEDGKSYTFTLREGVKFSDGTDFNAEAVCANFDRWYNWTGVNQSENLTYYYGKLFRGFKTGKTGGIYDSCAAASPTEATVKLTKPFAAFVQAMTLPAFSMQSPTAMKEYNADDTPGTEDDPRFSAYATEHPTGTGPFVFEKWERDQQVMLKRNDNYWGDKSKVDRVIIRTISDSKARTQELQAGNIDGYDLVGPADVQPLKDAGFQIQNRPAFNILYLGMNQKNKALQDVKVRAGDRPRDRQGGRGQVLAARGLGPGQGVHARTWSRATTTRSRTRPTTSTRPRSCSRRPARRTWSSSSPTRRASRGRTCRPRRTPSR